MGAKRFLFLLTGDVSEPSRSMIGNYDERFGAMMGLPASETLAARVHAGDPIPDLDAVRAVVISGSPAMITDHHAWAEQAAVWVRGAVERGVPILGVCFGHQLLAYACGGAVARMAAGPEYGTAEVALTDDAATDPLFRRLPPRFPAQESHCEAVTSLPPTAVLLARSPKDRHHAFRIGTCAWGVQFHPERPAAPTRRMLDHNRPSLEKAGVDVARVLDGVRECPDSERLLPAFRDLAMARSEHPGPARTAADSPAGCRGR